MKGLKKLFMNSRLGLGLVIGIFLGNLIGGGSWDGGIAAALTLAVIGIIAENMFFAKSKK